MIFYKFLSGFTDWSWLIFLRVIDWFWLFLKQLSWDFNLFFFFTSYNTNNVTNLTNRQCVHYRLIFLCNFYLLFAALIENKFSWKLMSRSWVALWFYQHHSSSYCIWLFFQPLYSEIIKFDSHSTYLSAFSEFDRNSETFYRVDLNSSKRAFGVRAKM